MWLDEQLGLVLALKSAFAIGLRGFAFGPIGSTLALTRAFATVLVPANFANGRMGSGSPFAWVGTYTAKRTVVAMESLSVSDYQILVLAHSGSLK
jgi:hypothetical protein